MDKAVVLPGSQQPFSFSEYSLGMLLLADHGDNAMCYRVNGCTWESDNKVRALVCVLLSGSWTIRCRATVFLTKSTVCVLPNTVLACSKMYMATQALYILLPDPATERCFIIDLPEGVELD
jgi:hypothetical protein